MKYKLLILVFLLSINIYSQTKEIIFVFDNKKDSLVEKFNEEIYILNDRYSYVFKEKKHIKKTVDFKLKSNDAIDYNDFIKLNKHKKFPDYYNLYSFFILIKEESGMGCLIEVEKIWLVENKIYN